VIQTEEKKRRPKIQKEKENILEKKREHVLSTTSTGADGKI
jgi:hypothetical protein